MALWPTGTETAPLPLVTVKPVPAIVAWEILTAAVPVFVNVTLWVKVVPVATFPKLKLEGFAVRTPV